MFSTRATTHARPPLEPRTGAGPTPASVRLTDLHRTYEGAVAVRALRGVSLDLAPGSVTAVMGPSGSGKSTLLNCAAGLDVPDHGHVLVGGTDISSMSDDELTRFRRTNVGFVFQSYNLLAHLDVRDNVELPLVLAGQDVDTSWTADLLGQLGLAGLQERLPGELSGGQAQRVAIARALVTRPTVVFADEPTGALDSRAGAQVLGVFLEVARQLGQTLVLVTHDSTVAAVAEEVVLLSDGLIADRLTRPSTEQISTRLLELGR